MDGRFRTGWIGGKMPDNFHDDRGQELYFDVERDYRKENLSVTLTGKNPENLKEHHGINIMMAEMLCRGFKTYK